ncbi:MAG TPA: hypothetical protein VGR10_03405 [Thermoleophilaceae bacterium]|nr:hypothetical protein [Thermoleophilaceae bacterium]
MRFVDFLKMAVLLFAGAANALALVTIIGADVVADRALLFGAFGWWLVAALAGGWAGRRPQAFAGVRRLLAAARTSPALPELEPGALLFNRLWALGAFTFAAGGVGFVFPEVSALAVGFPLMAALAIRRQAPAVQAVEERDGVRFYIDRTSALRPTELLRTPGLKKWADEREPAREGEAAR